VTSAGNPFRPLTTVMSSRESDDAMYVEKLRKTVRQWDRWRWWLVAFHAVIFSLLVVSICCIFSQLQQDLNSFGILPQYTSAISGIVFSIGLKSGFWFCTAIQCLVTGLSGMRKEQMLLELYDEKHRPFISPVSND